MLQVKLIPVTRDLEEEIQAFRQECLENDSIGECGIPGATFLATCESIDKWFNHLESSMKVSELVKKYKKDLKKVWIEQKQWALVDNDSRILGMTTLLEGFNDIYKRLTGHIGYTIRPSERNKGYGKKMLELSLEIYKGWGFSRVIVSCEEKNAASRQVILSQKGVLEEKQYRKKEDDWVEIYGISVLLKEGTPVYIKINVADMGITNATKQKLIISSVYEEYMGAWRLGKRDPIVVYRATDTGEVSVAGGSYVFNPSDIGKTVFLSESDMQANLQQTHE